MVRRDSIKRIPGRNVSRLGGLRDALSNPALQSPVIQKGLNDALANAGRDTGESSFGKRLDRWGTNLITGPLGVTASAREAKASFDPRTRTGLINLASMLIPGGKGPHGDLGEAALEAHLGHSEFRPYDAQGIRGRQEGMAGHLLPDQVAHGGAMPWKGGEGDMGYPNFGPRMRDIHGYSLAELLGLVESRRIVGPRRIQQLNNRSPGAGFLHLPWRTQRGLNN